MMVLARPFWSWQDQYGPGMTTMVLVNRLLSWQGYYSPRKTIVVLAARTIVVPSRPLWSWQDHYLAIMVRPGPQLRIMVRPGQVWSGQDHNWQLWSGQDHNWQVVVRPGPQVPKKLKHKRARSCTLLLVCFRPAHTYFGTILNLCTLLLCELVMLQQLWSS